jgi:sugar phosphate isomerase/epimerase
MFTFGAEILPYHDFSLEESLRELSNLGFTHVNLWSSRTPLAHHVNPGDDSASIKALLRKYGITPTGLTMYGKTQAEMRQRIEFAAEIGIDTVVFDCEKDDDCSPVLGPAQTCEKVGCASPSRTTSRSLHL